MANKLVGSAESGSLAVGLSDGIAMDESGLIECIDQGLGILGIDNQREIYWRILLSRKMNEASNGKGILRDPAGFLNVIEETFGIGAWAIERAIVQEIRRHFDLEDVLSDSLVVAITAAMRKISLAEDNWMFRSASSISPRY